MVSSQPGPRSVPLQRTEFVTRDLDAVAEMLRAIHVEHRPRLRFTDPDRAEASTKSVTVGPLGAGAMYWHGAQYTADDIRPASAARPASLTPVPTSRSPWTRSPPRPG